MQAIADRLESLLEERAALIERYAPLWATHGGGSQTWEKNLLSINTVAVKAELREVLAEQKKDKARDLDEALDAHPVYRSQVRKIIEGRTEWARVQQQMKTLEWRIQLELAKLRLALGDEASPAEPAVAEEVE